MKSDFVVNGSTFRYVNAEVRVALSGDASQYVVTVVAPSYAAAFSDEHGIIYTGKALD